MHACALCKIKIILGYDETMSHNIEAAADIYLMPSTFEPCGLNQLYSLRYGTLPIVRNVGGLADTVIDTTEETIEDGSANGFVVTEHTVEALSKSIKRALELNKDKDLWSQLQRNAMSREFSWQKSASEYVSLYTLALTDITLT